MVENLAIRFEGLYRGLQRAHGTFRITHADDAKKGKMVGRAITVYETPTVEKWVEHLAGTTGIGIVPIDEHNMCRWGAIDIDTYRAGLVEEVEERTRALKLPVVCIRTKSGGVHVTAFVTEPIDARMMRAKMMEMAAALGVAGVEIYPKQVQLASERDTGNWLNMPYFNMKDTTRYAVYKGRGLTAEEFLDLAYALRSTPEQFLATSCADGGYFDDGPPCLQTIAAQGVQVGTRNESLFAMGVYARLKHDANWEDRVDEMNQMFIQPPLASREVQGICKSLSRKSYFYPCSKPPIVNFCNKEVCRHREYGIGQGDQEPTLEIGTLVKICTDPPSWIIDVEGVRFEIETDDLMSQARFAKVCVEKINKWPGRVKPSIWMRTIQNRLDNVEVIEAPLEASPEGRFMWHLEQFCVVSAPARVKEELLLGKPWTDEGRHFFRSEDLMRYLNQHHFRDVSPRKAWSLLRSKAGAQHKQFQLKGRCVQCWSIPEFKRQDADFERASPEVDF
ncbi:TOTE conflict system archaeo-eukaryotic primase domain-containing protein [Immundisolibacter sp.]